MKASHFRELEVWQLAMELAKSVYVLSADFPVVERYGLASQVQRAAVSIPSNIAEGNGRQSTREYARFVSVARGSVAELQTQLLLAQSLGLGKERTLTDTLELCERVSMMLARLHQGLNRKLQTKPSPSPPGSQVPGPESPIEGSGVGNA